MIVRGVLITALLTISGTAWAQAAGDYFADPKTHCKLWWPEKDPKYYTTTSVQWKGACSKGMAQGKGTFEAVVKNIWKTPPYDTTWSGEGDFVNGKLSGRGFMVSTDGERLEGEFRDGALNGKGITTSTSPRLTVREESEYRDGKKNGWGTWDMREPDGGFSRYEGDWRDNEKNGRGVYVRGKRGCAAQMRYEGEWKNDRMSGRGTVKLLNGKTYSGIFEEGSLGKLSQFDIIPLADDFKNAGC